MVPKFCEIRRLNTKSLSLALVSLLHKLPFVVLIGGELLSVLSTICLSGCVVFGLSFASHSFGCSPLCPLFSCYCLRRGHMHLSPIRNFYQSFEMYQNISRAEAYLLLWCSLKISKKASPQHRGFPSLWNDTCTNHPRKYPSNARVTRGTIYRNNFRGIASGIRSIRPIWGIQSLTLIFPCLI